jgi:hypothetical protein
LELSDCCGQAPVLESMPFLQSAFIRLNENQGSCDVMYPPVQKCAHRSCECCYGYHLSGYQSVLLNGLSNATHLELIAHPEVVCIKLLSSTLSLFAIHCFSSILSHA